MDARYFVGLVRWSKILVSYYDRCQCWVTRFHDARGARELNSQTWPKPKCWKDLATELCRACGSERCSSLWARTSSTQSEPWKREASPWVSVDRSPFAGHRYNSCTYVYHDFAHQALSHQEIDEMVPYRCHRSQHTHRNPYHCLGLRAVLAFAQALGW